MLQCIALSDVCANTSAAANKCQTVIIDAVRDYVEQTSANALSFLVNTIHKSFLVNTISVK